jgi:hypothetical protein
MRRSFRICFRCGSFVKKETHKGLRKEYPFVCLNCYENMYRFETIPIRKFKKKRKSA